MDAGSRDFIIKIRMKLSLQVCVIDKVIRKRRILLELQFIGVSLLLSMTKTIQIKV